MKSTKKWKNYELIICGLVILQILYLMFFNLTRLQYAVNFDTCEYLIQVMQIWKQKTLFIQNYYYSTMLTWDMPTLLAVPFYGLTGNVFLAWGIAADILIVLFAAVLIKLCRDLNFDRFTTLFILLCVFAMYQYGYIDYIEELFINGALYGFRIMFMLIFMDIAICLHKNIHSWCNILLYILGFVGMFLCGASTGIFAIGCCMAPLLISEVWLVIIDKEPVSVKKFFNKPVIVLCMAIVVSFLGVLCNKAWGLSQSISTQKYVITPAEMGTNFLNVITGIFELFGWPTLFVPEIVSIGGIVAIGAACIALCYIFALGLTLYLAFFRRKEIENTNYIFTLYVVFTFIVNLALFTFVDLSYSSAVFEYRYWIIIFVPLFVELGVLMQWLKNCVYDNVKKAFFVCFITGVCIISLGKDISRYRNTDYNVALKGVMDEVNQMGLDEVYIYLDWAWSREMCAFADGDTEYFAVCNFGTGDDGVTYFENELKMPKWGMFVKYDRDCLEMPKEKTKGIIVCDLIGEDKNFLERRAKESIPFEGTEFTLLIMDNNYMDFVYGVPENENTESRDYFNWHYTRDALILNQNGKYESDGRQGEILSGTFSATQNGAYSAYLQYKVIQSDVENAGKLRISVMHMDGTSTLYEENISSTKEIVSIDSFALMEGDTYVVSVEENEGTIFELSAIEYARK